MISMRKISFVGKTALLLALCGVLIFGWKFRRAIRHAFDAPAQAASSGWVGETPPLVASLDSGKRSNVFYVGEAISFAINKPFARFEVRNYQAEIVDGGRAANQDARTIALKKQPPGWYKLYVFGERDQGGRWGEAIGGTTFVVFRRDARFPALPSRDVPSGSDSNDQPMRGVLGMGPQRLRVEDAAKPEEAIAKIEQDVALDRRYYLPFDPIRKRVLLCAFPNGTKGKESGVRQIVAHFQNDIAYWETRNEPNFAGSGRDFALNELKPFYETVKSVNPSLKVLGPGTVSVNPGTQAWLDDFFGSGGGKYLDAFSFHAYSNLNGDLWLARKSLDTIDAMLKKYGLQKLEKWQTEQGYFAAMYGVYAPAHQARWTMLQMMIFESYGIPKEHNHMWYDRSHGFWDVPAWWENEDNSLNPAAPLMRVWSEELFGTRWNRVLDFGSGGNRVFFGNGFKGANDEVLAMMSAGATDARVELRVSSGQTLKVVSAWGVEKSIAVKNGRAFLVVPELPVYVRSSARQRVEIVPQSWGENLARQKGTKVSASQSADRDGVSGGANAPEKVVNGEMESWYWNQKPESTPWNAFDPRLPMTFDIQLPRAQSIGRVVVFAAPPWSYQSTLLSFDVQVELGAAWKTVARVREPARTWKVYTPTTKTSVDSFHSERWIFPTSFAPVVTSKVRLLIRDATWGGGALKIVSEAGGQAWDKPIVMLREVEIYSK